MGKKKNKVEKISHKPIAKASFGKMKRMVQSIERDYGGSPEIIDNMNVTFEYIIASLFPDIMDNIRKELADQYIKGFNDRLKINNKIEDGNLFHYLTIDIERAINDATISIRKDGVSDNDKVILKKICENLEELANNINKSIKE